MGGAEEQHREWKTEGEIRNIVHAESKDWHDEVRETLKDLTTVIQQTRDLSRDAAQASFNTAIILTGDEKVGIRGAIPEIKERLSAVEQKQEEAETSSNARHDTNSGRLDRLEAGQFRIRKAVVKVYEWLTEGGEKSNVRRLGLLWGGGILLANYFLTHWQMWVKKLIAMLGHSFGN